MAERDKINETDLKIWNRIRQRILTSLISTGHLDPDTMSPESMLQVFNSFMKREDFEEVFNLTIDRRETLNLVAAQQKRKGNYEIAIVLNAAWVEHTVNGLIGLGARRLAMDSEDTKKMLMLNLDSKIGWLFKVLLFPPLAVHRRKQIIELAEARNSFLHYKWPIEPWEDDSRTDRHKTILAKTKDLKRYLSKYENRIFHGKNSVQKIDKMLKAHKASKAGH